MLADVHRSFVTLSKDVLQIFPQVIVVKPAGQPDASEPLSSESAGREPAALRCAETPKASRRLCGWVRCVRGAAHI